jgi:hypothetical protein
MKKVLFFFAFSLLTVASSFAQAKYEFRQVTAVESVVPGGLGRSRLITTGKDGKIEEIKLENFFSLVGINFGNIKENDKIITTMIEGMYSDNWVLENVSTGVYGVESSTGIFITRYLFKREKK